MGLFRGGSGLFSGIRLGEGIFGDDLFEGSSTGVFRGESKILLREIIKKSDTSAGEFLRTVDDAKNELHELCTDGFVEMVIKGNSDYKTSFEIKEEADKRIANARRRYQEK